METSELGIRCLIASTDGPKGSAGGVQVWLYRFVLTLTRLAGDQADTRMLTVVHKMVQVELALVDYLLVVPTAVDALHQVSTSLRSRCVN